MKLTEQQVDTVLENLVYYDENDVDTIATKGRLVLKGIMKPRKKLKK